jgi:hypothetical protein
MAMPNWRGRQGVIRRWSASGRCRDHRRADNLRSFGIPRRGRPACASRADAAPATWDGVLRADLGTRFDRADSQKIEDFLADPVVWSTRHGGRSALPQRERGQRRESRRSEQFCGCDLLRVANCCSAGRLMERSPSSTSFRKSCKRVERPHGQRLLSNAAT